VAFLILKQANKAINGRLYIAGISAKVARFQNTSKTTQCLKYSGFGHLLAFCKKEPKCVLCAESHIMENHKCSICKAKKTSCLHLVPKCANCNSNTHSANSKACEIYLALQNKTLDPIIIDNEL